MKDWKTWLIGVLTTAIVSAAGIAWSKADGAYIKASINEARIQDMHESINRIESKVDKILERK